MPVMSNRAPARSARDYARILQRLVLGCLLLATIPVYAQTATSCDISSASSQVSRSFRLPVGSMALAALDVLPAGQTLPDGTVNVGYSQTFSATGGTAPYDFECTGELPDGLSLDSTGQLTGIPSEMGTFQFTITATDSETATNTGFRDYTLTIVDEPIVLAPASLSNGVVGTPYHQDIDASGGGIAPYSFSITGGALPPGLSLSTDGEISGTPIAQGTFNFYVTAHDRFMAASGSGAYSVTIMAPEIGIDPTTLPIATVGTAYEQPLTASGGTPPYSYAVTGGSLPAGMGMDGDGIIEGTPEVSGDFAFTVTATDAHAQTGDRDFTLSVIAPVIGIVPTAVPDATVGVDYEVLFVATGGNGPHSFAVTAGSLPAGLFLSSDGTLNGAPTTQGDYAFTVTATDTFNQTGEQAYDISVQNAVITISPASVPAGAVGTAYEQALSASGGTGPYSYMISGGSLPQGMGMDGDGIIDGTPEEPGNFGFTVIATDTFGQAGEKTYSLSINAPTILVSPGALPDGEVGSEYGQALSASGGNAPYTFAISSGALPAGMHLGSDGALAGTPTVAGSFAFTITATDNYDQVGTQAFVLVISGATITLGPASLPDGAVGLAYQQALSASGGSDPYSFAITDGNLPTGLVMGVDGIINGIPQDDGNFGFSVTATDAHAQSAQRAYTLVINGASIVVAPGAGALAAATVDTAYQQLFSASGGIAPYSFAIGGGSLPPGMALASDGTLSGTPTVDGVFEFTVLATDAFGQEGNSSYSIAVSAAALPDPTEDPEVTGLLVSQVSTVRTFVTSQVMNVHDRMESLHDGGGSGSGGRWGFWIAGSVRSGDRDANGEVAPLSFETSGMTGGSDYRVNNNFAFGGALGYARDRTAVGSDGSRNDADAPSGVSYMSWHPEDLPFFLDGMGGYQEIDFEVRRFSPSTGVLLQGRRNGKQQFTSWSGGYEYRNEDETFLFSPYARMDAANARLNSFSEEGTDPYALHFGPQDIDLRTSTLGFRMKYRMPTDWGEFEPRLRVEYQRDFHDDSGVAISFANQQGSPVFFSAPLGLDKNRVVVELGSIFRTNWHGLLIRVDYLGVYGGYNDNEHAVRFSMQED